MTVTDQQHDIAAGNIVRKLAEEATPTEERIAAAEAALEYAPAVDPYKILSVWQFWDTANTVKAESDYWVCETWAYAANGFFLLEVYQGKHEFPDGVKKIEDLYKHPPSVPDADGQPIVVVPKAVFVESTGANNGAACVQSLLLKRPRIPAIEQGTGNQTKEARADVAIETLRSPEQGPFYFPAEQESFTGCSPTEFYGQHTEFPNGVHDDMVDVTSMAVAYLRQYTVPDSVGLAGTRTAVNMGLGRRADGDRSPRGAAKTPRQFNRGNKHIKRGQFSR